MRAIDRSKMYLPIFSKNYAASKWCLRELTAMVEHVVKPDGGKTIIPIFYDVKPCDVRLKTPLYHDALVKHKKRYGSNKVKAWEHALTRAGSLTGWDIGLDR